MASVISFMILKGFQKTVKEKIFGFSGHLLLGKYTMSNSTEEEPMNIYTDVYINPEKYPEVRHVQEVAHKPGLVKTGTEILGVVLKGISSRFDSAGFSTNLVEGRMPHFSDSGYSKDIVISRNIADKLNIGVGDNMVVHFFQNPPRFRKLEVCGIYQTNLSEYYDSKIILGDIRIIRRLNDWSDSLAGGLEVFVKDPTKIDAAGIHIGEEIDYDLAIERISDKYIQIFEWLDLLSRQVNILLVIILAVVSVNMVSIILLLVMERTTMIGLLKALGAGDGLIRKIFIWSGIRLIVKGLLWGNILALLLCFIQYKTGVITLKPEDYYMSEVPVSWEWEIMVVLNLVVLLMVTLVLILPTLIIARISPIKAIRFD